jgi:hypothetical protein
MGRGRAGAVVLALACVAVLGQQPAASAKTATATGIYASGVDFGKERVDAVLTRGSNHRGISGESLVFRYYKKVAGAWHLRGTKTRTTSGLGVASALFNAAAHGRCKVTVSFDGSSALAASKDSWRIDCASGGKL